MSDVRREQIPVDVPVTLRDIACEQKGVIPTEVIGKIVTDYLASIDPNTYGIVVRRAAENLHEIRHTNSQHGA